jgi:hypothetical protein
MVGAARAAIATPTAGMCWTAQPTLTLSEAGQELGMGLGSLCKKARVR